MEDLVAKDVASVKRKRGGQPIGERVMTAAERKKSSRANMAMQGSREFMVRLDQGRLNFIDQLAQANNSTRSETIEVLLDMAIARVALAVSDADKIQVAGGSEQDVIATLRTQLEAIPAPRLLEKYKEVTGIK